MSVASGAVRPKAASLFSGGTLRVNVGGTARAASS
jgi:hypothetical protein